MIESDFNKIEGISGRKLYIEVLSLSNQMKEKYVKSLFFNRLKDKETTYNELIGYALEYYHVVKMAPSLLGPALSNVESRETQKLLQGFLASELNHDKMLERSLDSVHIKLDELEYVQPLPSTFSICSMLGVLAKQHPLSFKAILFLFEQPTHQFNDFFLERCKALEIPECFYKPILAHSDINEDGEHDDISRVLLSKIPWISKEEAYEVKKNVISMVEFLAQQDIEIVNYYKQKDNKLMRVW